MLFLRLFCFRSLLSFQISVVSRILYFHYFKCAFNHHLVCFWIQADHILTDDKTENCNDTKTCTKTSEVVNCAVPVFKGKLHFPWYQNTVTNAVNVQ